MNSTSLPQHSPYLSIAAVERETGLAKDTLRVWEKRYGFPQPLRDAAGDRLYPMDQVQQLKLIRRLLDTGMRPGKVVSLDSAALQALIQGCSAEPAKGACLPRQATAQPSSLIDLEPFLYTIGTHDPQALRHALSHAQWRMGLAPFVVDLVAPLVVAVGQAWVQGRFEVYEEHLFTEVITGMLRNAIASIEPRSVAQGPKVLLTTLPEEKHGLGLLMVEALLTLEGCTCVSLGTQTPIGDVAQAALAHRVHIVGLSFTNVHTGMTVKNSLRELRSLLPPDIALWAGGSCTALHQKSLEGITVTQDLEALPALVAQWRLAQ